MLWPITPVPIQPRRVLPGTSVSGFGGLATEAAMVDNVRRAGGERRGTRKGEAAATTLVAVPRGEARVCSERAVAAKLRQPDPSGTGREVATAAARVDWRRVGVRAV